MHGWRVSLRVTSLKTPPKGVAYVDYQNRQQFIAPSTWTNLFPFQKSFILGDGFQLPHLGFLSF